MNKMEIIYLQYVPYLQHSREESEINTGSTCIQIFYKTDKPIYHVYNRTLFRTPLHGSEKGNDKMHKTLKHKT